MTDSNPRNSGNSSNSPTDDDTPTHQDFHWTEGPAQGTPYADFLETVLDVSTGIRTCLQIAYASNQERAANADAEPGQRRSPAVSIVEADHLFRLSIAAAGLLRDDARLRVDWLSEVPSPAW
jgi:hypothetical protein